MNLTRTTNKLPTVALHGLVERGIACCLLIKDTVFQTATIAVHHPGIRAGPKWITDDVPHVSGREQIAGCRCDRCGHSGADPNRVPGFVGRHVIQAVPKDRGRLSHEQGATHGGRRDNTRHVEP